MSTADAKQMFKRFHGREWRGEGELAIEIPARAICIGDAVNVLYRSDKLNPATREDEGWIDYIHEHGAGVKIYRPTSSKGPAGAEVTVPAWLRRTEQVTWLGKSLGFAFRADGREHRAKATDPLPDLFATANGKALLVVQQRRTLLAMIWGGRLGVQARGIVH